MLQNPVELNWKTKITPDMIFQKTKLMLFPNFLKFGALYLKKYKEYFETEENACSFK